MFKQFLPFLLFFGPLCAVIISNLYSSQCDLCINYGGIVVQIMAYGQMGAGKTYTMMGDGTFAGRGLVSYVCYSYFNNVYIHIVKEV